MWLTIVTLALASVAVSAAEVCELPQKFHTVSALPEASGVAAGSSQGLLWSFNDSAEPTLVAFDTDGKVKGRVRVSGAAVTDWEDISAGACGAKRCLYIADIGDNRTSRNAVTVYRVPEPSPADASTDAAETFVATYPDGPHDAEAVFVTASGEVYLITKTDKAPALYKFPSPLKSGARMRLERVASIPHRQVTDAETSRDGAWVAVRTNTDLFLYRTADIVAGGGAAVHVDLKPLGEPQGEGVAFGANGNVYLVGEGGGRRAAGTVATLMCRLPRS